MALPKFQKETIKKTSTPHPGGDGDAHVHVYPTGCSVTDRFTNRFPFCQPSPCADDVLPVTTLITLVKKNTAIKGGQRKDRAPVTRTIREHRPAANSPRSPKPS